MRWDTKRRPKLFLAKDALHDLTFQAFLGS